MIGRVNCLPNEGFELETSMDDNRPRGDYFSRLGRNLIPSLMPRFLTPLPPSSTTKSRGQYLVCYKRPLMTVLPDEKRPLLSKIAYDHLDVFRTTFSSSPSATVSPLKIELVSYAKPQRVCPRNYSQEQRTFLSNFVSNLVKNGMAYANPSSPWACAPLLVPKPGPDKFWFTVDLRSVNRFTVKH